jgi:2-polyprenyl-6-methoxyphenol hydroxylase-like FAD-dependent oxidoreductase
MSGADLAPTKVIAHQRRGIWIQMDHVVVVGGSFAGVVCARVLSEHFAQVTILESDDVTPDVAPRKGVPQGAHVHGILQLGREIMDGLFPGFVAETQKEGAILFDAIAGAGAFGPNGWTARGKSNIRGFGVRRPLLENIARRRVLELPNVTIVRGRAEGLVVGASRRVEGIVARTDSGEVTISADLVVDTSGRGSAAMSWLEREGFPVPEETVVQGFGGYASRLLRVPDDAWPAEGLRFMATLPRADLTRGAILYPQDNGYNIISLFGQSRDYPPREEEAFDEFLASLATPLVHQVVSKSEKVSEIKTSRSTANRWRHYERLTEFPAGLVIVGDAAACFNPMAGQGISAACVAGIALRDTLLEVGDDLSTLPVQFHQRQAKSLQFPWSVAVGFDLQFPASVGERPERTPEVLEMGRYMKGLMELATVDVQAAEAVLKSNQTFDRSVLRAPAIAAKVEDWISSGSRPPPSDPMQVPALQESSS